MENTRRFTSKLAHHGWDVIVCGGGPAGIAAALAASRNGAKTLLLEATGCLGGMSTSGNVPTLASYQYDRVLIRGIGLEILKQIQQRGGSDGNDNIARFIPIDGEILKSIYDDLLIDAGVSLRLFTFLIDTRAKGRRIKHLITASKVGIEAWSASMFIDATGDADLAARGGVVFQKGDEHGMMQAVTLCFAVTGLDYERANCWARRKGYEKEGEQPFRTYLREVKKTALTNPGDFMVNDTPIAKNLAQFNYNHVYGVDGTDPDDLTRAMIEGRKIMVELVNYLRDHVPGCENIRIVRSGSLPGVRETRRIAGDFLLTEDDFFNACRHKDDIAVYAYPIDIHPNKMKSGEWLNTESNFYSRRLPPGAFYGIPYRSLIPRGLDNLLVAGRSISCDRNMQGSLRVMPACFATGEAAGTAAALAALADCTTREVNIKALQTRLRKQGAYIPGGTRGNKNRRKHA